MVVCIHLHVHLYPSSSLPHSLSPLSLSSPPFPSLLTSMPYAQSHYHLRTRRCLKQPSLLTSSQRALTKREDGENIMSFVAFGTICWCFCVHVCITTTYSHCRQCKFYDHKVQWPNVFILTRGYEVTSSLLWSQHGFTQVATSTNTSEGDHMPS